MQEIKLVLTDLDGTAAYPEAHEVSDEVLSVIREGEERGVKFCAVTGRPFWMAKDLLALMGIQEPCIFDGGASIAVPSTGEVLWSKFLPSETTRAAVEILLPFVHLIEYDMGTLTQDQVDLEAIVNPALCVWASVPVTEGERLVEELRRLPDVAVHGNPHPGGDKSKWGVQVTHAEADKEHAVRVLLGMMSIDRDHTLAVGDGNNDLPLFRIAGTKIAMGNGTDALKAAADHIVGTVQEDGFAQAIRRFVLRVDI